MNRGKQAFINNDLSIFENHEIRRFYKNPNPFGEKSVRQNIKEDVKSFL